jgi:hypothetical protein
MYLARIRGGGLGGSEKSIPCRGSTPNARGPRPLARTFSTLDPTAAEATDEVLEAVYIDTGEDGIFSMEEFALVTTAARMEFVTPEEIAS